MYPATAALLQLSHQEDQEGFPLGPKFLKMPIYTYFDSGNGFRSPRHKDPASFPSLLRQWIAQGGTHFQRFFSRLRDGLRFFQHLALLPDLQSAARLREVLSAISSQPLRTLPNKPERIYTNSNFQWYLCNRIQATHPPSRSIFLQTCVCQKPTILPFPLGNGRHFRRCKKQNTILKVHDTLRDLLILMCKAAGLTVRREPHGLLSDNPEEKPSDLLIKDWTIEGIANTRHAIGLMCPE